MAKAKDTRSRAQRLLEVRYPFVYVGISALWVTSSVLRLFDPAHAHDQGSLILAIITGVLALGVGAAAIVNLVMRARGIWPSERTPLAQESDPSLRQTS